MHERKLSFLVKSLLFAFLISTALVEAPAASVVDSPHNESNGITCGSCHSYSLWWRYSPVMATSDYQSVADAVCNQCHGPEGPEFIKAGHSTSSMGAPHPVAGNWSTKCVDCHNPHLQQQVKWLSSSSLFNDGSMAGGFFLVEGEMSAITDNGNGTTTFHFANGLAKAGWEEPTEWTMKSGHADRGLILSLGYGKAEYTYEVVAASVVTAVPSALPATGEGTITVQTGNAPLPTLYENTAFGLFYGQLVKDVIQTPHSGARNVKFFDGRDALIHTTATTRDGVCQVCHTLTKYWRNDGDADPATGKMHNPTITCTVCHHSETGFKPSGGPHPFLEESPACMTCHPSGDILAIHQNDCQHCHTTPPTLADPASKPLVSAILQGTCQECHGLLAHPSETAHNHRQITASCSGCHGVTEATEVDALHQDDCATCHGYTGTKLDPATVASAIVTGKGPNNTDVDCQTCHTVGGGHDTTSSHNHRQTVASCAACHAISSQTAIDTLHRQECGTCHGYTGTKLDPATVANAISTGKGPDGTDVDCQTCHTTGHETTAAHNLRQPVSFCAGCHAVATAAAVDVLHGNDCLTCHAYSGTKLNAATVAAVIASGKGVNGTPVDCRGCHDDKGALHHLQANATSGNCTACHPDPRPSRGGTAPGDNGGTAQYPTQLACRQCHVRVVGTTIQVDKLAYDLNLNGGAISRTTQHTIAGISNGQIPNFGMCLSCHDGNTATKVRVFHAKPPYRIATEAMMLGGAAPGRQSLNFFYSSLRNPIPEQDPTVPLRSRGSDNRHIRDTTMNPMVSYKSIAIPCDNAVNGCTYGQPSVTVPVLPALNAPPDLHIDSIWPAKGRPGITVTLAGTFNVGSAPYVYIGQTSAPATSWTPTTVTFVMPSGNSWAYPYGVMVKADGNNSNRVVFTFQDIADADLDGVADTLDQCPNTSIMQTVDSNGCAESQLETVIAFSAPTSSVAEDGATATITVTRTGSGFGPATVHYSTTAAGTAAVDADFTPTSGTLTWAADEMAAKTFEISIVDNQIYHADKTVALTLDSPTGNLALLGDPSTATLTIVNDDPEPPPTIAFTASPYSVAEDGGTATITVSRTWSLDQAVDVSYETNGGDAVDGMHFTATSGTLHWGIGDGADKTFTVAIIDNDVYSPVNRRVGFLLKDPTGGAILGSPLWAELTIVENEVPATIAFASATSSVNENDSTGKATFTVKRHGNSVGAVQVYYQTDIGVGTAIQPDDYAWTWGYLTWADGDTTDKTFTVDIHNNSAYAVDKTVVVSLYPVSMGNATLGEPASTTLTIVNDDPPTVALNAASYSVNENVGTATITVSRTGNYPGPVSVSYATTSDGTASPTDFTATSGTLTWADGDMTDKTFDINIIDNSDYAANKTVSLALSSPTGGPTVLGSPQAALLTIVNDDAAIAFTAPSFTVNENGGMATISVSRLGNSTGEVGVSYATTSSGTATPGVDYTPTSGVLNWASGDMAAKSFSIPIMDNAVCTGERTVTLALTSPTGGATILGVTNTAVLTIAEDETTIVFSAPNYSVEESVPGGVATITAKRLGSSIGEVTVDYDAPSGGTATRSGTAKDYLYPWGSITWLDGDTDDKTFTVTIVDDAAPEGDETIYLRLYFLNEPPLGVTLGAPDTAVLTILAND